MVAVLLAIATIAAPTAARAQTDVTMPPPVSGIAPAVSDDKTVVTDESHVPVGPGIERSRLVRRARRSQVEGGFVSVNQSGGRAHLAAAVAGRGAWSAVGMDAWSSRSGAPVIMGLAMEPTEGQSPWIDGLMFIDGELVGWPPTGPVLRLSSEGQLAVMPPPAAPPITLSLSNTVDPIEIAGINCPLGDDPILITGTFPGDCGQFVDWPEGAMAVRLDPTFPNKAPGHSLWDASLPAGAREWLVERPVPARRLQLDRQQLGVIVPAAAADRCAALLAGAGPASLDVTLPLDVRLSVYTVTATSLVMANGRAAQADTVATQLPPRSWVATTADGGMAWLGEFISPSVEDPGLATSLLAAEFARRGAANAVELRPTAQRYWAEPLMGEKVDRSAAPRARLALLTLPQPITLDLPGIGRVSPLRVLNTSSMPPVADSRPLAALTDRRTGIDAALDHFWWAGLPPGVPFPPPETMADAMPLHNVELRLDGKSTVGAVDLVHAEVAGFSPQFNLRGWRLSGRTDPSAPWQVIEQRVLAEPTARERILVTPPRVLSDLRLEVTHPNFLRDGQTSRLAEIIVWGK